jgi:15-cis-phytoene synthase
MSDAFAYCTERVREGDKDRYLAALFAPPERRPLLHALYAADLEIAAVPVRAREPMAGELRLQWWREVVEGARPEEARASPVADALTRTIEQAGIREPVLNLIDGRASDLYPQAVPTFAELEAYAESTEGQVLRASCAILKNGGLNEHEIFRPAACALTFTQVLVRFDRDAARGKFRVPTDVVSDFGVEPAEVFAGGDSEALRNALGEFSRAALAHATRAIEMVGAVPLQARSAFLTVALVPLYLAGLRDDGRNPLTPGPDVAQWRRQWTLWRAARRWLR